MCRLSLQFSRSGRALKPSSLSLSPFIPSKGDMYSYDVYGNFRGLKPELIDLTLLDNVPDQIPDPNVVNKKAKASKPKPKKNRKSLVLSVKKCAKRKVAFTKSTICKFEKENSSKEDLQVEGKKQSTKSKIARETKLSNEEGTSKRTAKDINIPLKKSLQGVIQRRNVSRKTCDAKDKKKRRKAMIDSDTEPTDEEVSSNWTAKDITMLKRYENWFVLACSINNRCIYIEFECFCT